MVSAAVDFDLHGLAGVRLVDASPVDVAAVERQLGPLRAPLAREPEITVRFVEHLPNSRRVRLLGVDEAAFTDDAYLVLRSKHKSSARVQIPIEQIGGRCEIVCERGLAAVPLLIPILNLTVLGNGALPLHASAFNYTGKGVVTTGWSKGGKTESLLAFMARGAEYIGDEWIYVSPDGQRVFGIPEPIRVWNWHLEHLPRYRAMVRWKDRARLRTLKSLRWMGRQMGRAPLRRLPGAKVASRCLPIVERQLFVDLHPKRLFGDGYRSLATRFDHLFFVCSHASPEVSVVPVDPQEVARRMVHSLQYERADLMAHYFKFRFAFPGHRNELLESAETLQRELLTKVFDDKPCHAVYHPYPVAIDELYESMRLYC
jgi:hypothetical protein